MLHAKISSQNWLTLTEVKAAEVIYAFLNK